jgi:hypothetical protein
MTGCFAHHHTSDRDCIDGIGLAMGAVAATHPEGEGGRHLPDVWGAFIEFRAVTRAFVKGWSQLPKAGFDDAVGLGSCVRPKA